VNSSDQKTNHFERGNEDKLSSIGIGKINLIKNWLEEFNITGYSINDDLSIDCNQSVRLISCHMGNFPLYINFRNIQGSFLIRSNNLTTLRGCPKRVSGDFSCTKNELTNLDYMPLYVGGSFFCTLNLISDQNLKKIDKSVIKGSIFYDHQYSNLQESNTVKFQRNSDNRLDSLGIGKIELIKQWLDECKITKYSINPDLSIDVNETFSIYRMFQYVLENKLPDYIQFNNVYGHCNFTESGLTTLKGSPRYVQGFFSCSRNKLESLDYAPNEIEGIFYCYENKITQSEIDKYLNSGKICAGLKIKEY